MCRKYVNNLLQNPARWKILNDIMHYWSRLGILTHTRTWWRNAHGSSFAAQCLGNTLQESQDRYRQPLQSHVKAVITRAQRWGDVHGADEGWCFHMFGRAHKQGGCRIRGWNKHLPWSVVTNLRRLSVRYPLSSLWHHKRLIFRSVRFSTYDPKTGASQRRMNFPYFWDVHWQDEDTRKHW